MHRLLGRLCIAGARRPTAGLHASQRYSSALAQVFAVPRMRKADVMRDRPRGLPDVRSVEERQRHDTRRMRELLARNRLQDAMLCVDEVRSRGEATPYLYGMLLKIADLEHIPLIRQVCTSLWICVQGSIRCICTYTLQYSACAMMGSS